MSGLDEPTTALVRLAAGIAVGEPRLVAARCREALAEAVPPVWVDELLLQSVLMVGYPRALAAAQAWREAAGGAAVSLEDGADRGQAAAWEARGERLCRTIYGANYEKLRRNVRELHPALDAWMVAEGYGRTLARPGLDLVRRELCVIAQVAVQGADRQLHSHLRGALNAGASRDTVAAALRVALADCAPDPAERARDLWARISA